VVERGVAADGVRGDATFNNRTLRYPVGILAIGDSVATRYDVDYFVVIDLGGDDAFLNAAGGGLPVTRRTGSQTPTESFIAPALVLNVDVAGRLGSGVDARNPNGALGDDTYAPPANETGDYAQGSLWGLLLDTQGNDNYTAGGGAQGALGGLLLDLKGSDAYKASDLSQGATLLNAPDSDERDRAPGLPDDGNAPADSYGQPSPNSAALRRAPPGLHLDMGTEGDVRKARNASQGFSRGFADGAGAGILLDQGGDDLYSVNSDHGRGLHAQAVAGQGGIAILLDLKGNDTYTAWGVVSQAATISQSNGADPKARESAPGGPGAALLLDTGGGDRYQYADLLGLHDRSAQRGDNLTLQRAAVARRSSEAEAWRSAHVEPALHYDGEDASLGAVFGAGRRGFTSVDPANPTKADVNDLYVDIPTARLAIGGPQASRYDHEYAFIVDLGGRNAYTANAGGVVPDVLARQDARPGDSFGGRDAALPLFPVSLVLDAGKDGSLYETTRGLAQGAGFFSVGVLVDLGGDDRFVALPRALPGLGAAWAQVPPTIDASLAEPAWSNVTARAMLLRDVNDSRFVENFTLRVSNDADHLYLAIEGHTPSSETLAENDLLRIDVNPRRTLEARVGAEVDTITVRLAKGGDCILGDEHFDRGTTAGIVRDAPGTGGRSNVHGRVACAYRPADGTFVIEVAKPLRPGLPRDEQDLDLPYDRKAGFRKDDAHAGIRVGFVPAAAGNEYAWPPATTRYDGEGPYPANGDLSEEVSAWAVLALASRGEAGVPAPVTLTPALAQGAGLAGVGILAHLGTVSS
ncbi:MAG TPA: hypothetical protein VNX21_04520, partial [Candidatus Thermoplasmatota archaeon]|nr:hypothetical protein [Candidatus Thermoplasmatota archaeon]